MNVHTRAKLTHDPVGVCMALYARACTTGDPEHMALAACVAREMLKKFKLRDRSTSNRD